MPRPLIEPRKHDSIEDDSILLKQMTTYKRVATKHLKERHYENHDLKRVTEDSTEEEGSPKVFFVFRMVPPLQKGLTFFYSVLNPKLGRPS